MTIFFFLRIRKRVPGGGETRDASCTLVIFISPVLIRGSPSSSSEFWLPCYSSYDLLPSDISVGRYVLHDKAV